MLPYASYAAYAGFSIAPLCGLMKFSILDFANHSMNQLSAASVALANLYMYNE